MKWAKIEYQENKQMEIIICIAIYILTGYLLGKVYGFSGLLDILLFPIVVPLKIWLEIK